MPRPKKNPLEVSHVEVAPPTLPPAQALPVAQPAGKVPKAPKVPKPPKAPKVPKEKKVKVAKDPSAPKIKKAPSAYNLFVKQHYGDAEIKAMKDSQTRFIALAKMWKDQKTTPA